MNWLFIPADFLSVLIWTFKAIWAKILFPCILYKSLADHRHDSVQQPCTYLTFTLDSTFTFRSVAECTDQSLPRRWQLVAWSADATLNGQDWRARLLLHKLAVRPVSGSFPTPTSLPLVTQLSPAFWMDSVQRKPWRVPQGKTSDKVLVSDLSLFFQHISRHSWSCITCPRIIVVLG